MPRFHVLLSQTVIERVLLTVDAPTPSEAELQALALARDPDTHDLPWAFDDVAPDGEPEVLESWPVAVAGTGFSKPDLL